MEIRLSGGIPEMGVQGRISALPDLGGKIGGMIGLPNDDIPRRELHRMSWPKPW